VSVLYQVVHQQPRPLAQSVTWPPDDVEAVLMRAMAKAAEDRFGSMLDFSRALDAAVARVLSDTGKIVIAPGRPPAVRSPPARCWSSPRAPSSPWRPWGGGGRGAGAR
jgi:hypothetical protein